MGKSSGNFNESNRKSSGNCNESNGKYNERLNEYNGKSNRKSNGKSDREYDEKPNGNRNEKSYESNGKSCRGNGQVLSLKKYIVSVLKKRGLWDPELSYQVETTARDILLYRRLSDECLKEETEILIEETSRGGDKRYKMNPVFDAVKKYADVVRNDLKALCMNRSAKKFEKIEDNDAMDELMRTLNG